MSKRYPRPRLTARHPVPAAIPDGFRRFVPRAHYFARLGRTYIQARDPEPPVFGLQVKPRHGNTHGTGHGGFLATLLDTYMAAFLRHTAPDIQLWTTDLKLKYLRPVPVGAWLEAHCVSVTRQGDRAEVVCDLKVSGEVMCRGTARFKIIEKS